MLKFTATLTAAAMMLGAAGDLRAQDDDFDAAFLDGLEWREIGPWRGGRTSGVAGHAADSQFYVQATVGGVFITRDGGETWTAVADDAFGTASAGAVDIAPSDPNVIVVGMGESPVRGVATSHGDGVYRSTDGGRSWTHLGLEDSRHISSVKIHPDNPDIFWVAVQGAAYGPTEQRGVYMTTDGGNSFERVLYVSDTTGAIDLKYDAANPRILYAAMWDWQRSPWAVRSGGPGSGLHRSMDGGRTWQEIGGDDLPELKGKIGVAPSPAQPGRVWAVVEAKEKGGVWRSDDYGKSWRHMNGDRRIQARSWYYMHIFADPQDAETVYVQNAPFMKSTDGGRSFTQMARNIHGDHHDLWINPDNPDIMIGGNDGGAAVSFNGGKTWSSQHNQPTVQFYRVNVDNRFPYWIYGGQQDNSTVAIPSMGLNGAIGRDDYMRVGGCESGHVAFDRDNPRLIYAGCYLGQIEEFDWRTQTTRDIRVYPEMAFGVSPKDRKYRFNWNAPIVVSQHDPSVIYHAGNVVLKSTDRGHSWSEVSPDLTRNEADKQGPGGFPITNEVTENYNTIMYLAESPHDADVLYAGSDDGLVHVTRDGGESWVNITPRRAGEGMVNTIVISPHDPATAYIAFTKYKYNDHSPIIYRTDDFGDSWERIEGDLPDGHWVRVVREDPARPGLLFAGTEMGPFVSFNGGGNWHAVKAGDLPVVPVTDLRIHRGDLVVATQGRGFWVLDDMTPLRQMSEAVVEAGAHLFAPRTAHIINLEGGSWAGRGKNPPAGAIIQYSLADAPDLEESTLRLEVLNGDGTVIRRLESDAEKGAEGGGSGSGYALPAEAGLNRAIWDLKHDPLEQKLGGFVIAAGGDGLIDGHTAGPGEYTLRLTLGEQVVEQPLTVAFDPRLDYDPSHMAEQQRLVTDTGAMLAELQQSVLALRKIREQATLQKGLAEETENEALAGSAQSVIDAVGDWMDGVISTEREFFQDVLNWPDRLFSDLQFLYGNLDGAMPRVSQGMQDRHADLKGRFTDAMAARDALLAGAVADYNAAHADAGAGGIIMPPVTP